MAKKTIPFVELTDAEKEELKQKMKKQRKEMERRAIEEGRSCAREDELPDVVEIPMPEPEPKNEPKQEKPNPTFRAVLLRKRAEQNV